MHIKGQHTLTPKELRLLKAQWQKKLKGSGFDDIERPNGQLKTKDIRTIAWQNQTNIRDFFLTLDHLMTYYPDMPRDERSVLTLWTKGVYAKEIALRCSFSERKVHSILARYKALILAVNRLFEASGG